MTDRGDDLRRLDEIRNQVRVLKEQEEELKDSLLAEGLEYDGSVMFVDANGDKRYGFFSQTEKNVVDVRLLRELMGDAFVDGLCKPLELDLDKFRTARRKGLIDSATYARTVSVRYQGQTVRFDRKPKDAEA